MRAVIGVVVSGAMALLAGLCALLAGSHIVLTYQLPTPDGDGVSTHAEIFGPALVATIAGGLACALLVGWAGWNLAGSPRRAYWFAAVGVLVVAVAAFGYSEAVPTPTF